MIYKIPSKSGGDPHLVESRGGDNWTCDCLGFKYRRKCSHITEARTKQVAGRYRTRDKRWWKAMRIRDGLPVAFRLGGLCVTVFDGVKSERIAWDEASLFLQSVRDDTGGVIELDFNFVESCWLRWLVTREPVLEFLEEMYL